MPFYKGGRLQTAALLRKTERISGKSVQVHVNKKQIVAIFSNPLK